MKILICDDSAFIREFYQNDIVEQSEDFAAVCVNDNEESPLKAENLLGGGVKIRSFSDWEGSIIWRIPFAKKNG